MFNIIHAVIHTNNDLALIIAKIFAKYFAKILI